MAMADPAPLPHRRRSALVLIVLMAMIGLAVVLSPSERGIADAAYIPAADSVVLEKLATRVTDPKSRELRDLRAQLAKDPNDIALATRVARLDIERGRALGDPRYLGYAQAALAPWWDQPSPPPPVLLLRATIRQSSHDFEHALEDLDALVKLAPDNPQAWLTRSVVLAVRGRYAEAKASCQPLNGRTSRLVVAVCFASIDGVTGDARGAYETLSLLARATTDPDERSWAQSILGEIALRLGNVANAEEHFRSALAAEPGDPYVLGAYADLLLDQGRPAEAVALVKDKTANDALLLRLALAELALHAKDAASLTTELQGRFDASHLRGDTVHRREEARFELGLVHDPKKALDLAKANWDVQKEPWDVRVLVESALAAQDPAAAAPALAFLDDHHLEDPIIRSVADKLRGPR